MIWGALYETRRCAVNASLRSDLEQHARWCTAGIASCEFAFHEISDEEYWVYVDCFCWLLFVMTKFVKFTEAKLDINANTHTYKSSPKTRRTWKITMLRPPIGPSSFFINLVLSFLHFFRFRIQSKFTSKFLDWPKECLLLMKLSTSSSFQNLFSPKSKIVTAKSIRLKSQWYQIEFHVPQTIN